MAFVVRLGQFRDGVDTDVVRYDTAHGKPHRDLVSPTGRLREKFWFEDLSFETAMNRAIKDFREDDETYIRAQSEVRGIKS